MKRIKCILMMAGLLLLTSITAFSQDIAKDIAGKYVGTLTLKGKLFEENGEKIPNQSIVIDRIDNTHVKLQIKDFAFRGAILGDIKLDNEEIKQEADKSIVFVNSKKQTVKLAEGKIEASAQITDETTKILGEDITLNVLVDFQGTAIEVSFDGRRKEEPPVENISKETEGEYTGSTTVAIGENDPYKEESKIIVKAVSANTIDITLPKFKIDAATVLDDIHLKELIITKSEDGTIKFAGNKAKELSLMGGAIKISAEIKEDVSQIKGSQAHIEIAFQDNEFKIKSAVFEGKKSESSGEEPNPQDQAGVYQVPNSDFETEWTDKNEPGNGWYSFPSAKGNMSKFGKSMVLANTIKAEGHNSKTSVVISSKKVFIANANGNLTTGCINMGAMTPTDPQNYNYTDREGTNKLLFRGRPDALRFYAKFKRGEAEKDQKKDYDGQLKAILHDNIDFKDPTQGKEKEEMDKHIMAQAVVAVTPCNEWTKFEQKLDYTTMDLATDSTYMLVNLTTNPTPGASQKDSLWFDDFEFIYNSELTEIDFGGLKLDVTPDKKEYEFKKPYDASKFECTTNAKAAKVTKSYDEKTAVLTILVEGNDIAVNPTNKHEYKVQFRKPIENIAKYQMANGGFEEEWYDDNEPGNGWYSFLSAGGQYANFGMLTLGNTIKTEGHDSKTAVLISSMDLGMGKANGNLTTGRVNMGSITPADPQNYNYTDRASENHLTFIGQPDSIVFYAKYSRGEKGEYFGRLKAILHGDCDYRDPADPATQAEQEAFKLAEATCKIEPSKNWVRYTQPFTYTDNKAGEKSYMLINATTNPEPGATQKDSLALDDVLFIYNSELKTFEYDDQKQQISATNPIEIRIEGHYDESKIGKIETNARAARFEKDYDDETKELSIYVYGNDFEVNESNMHTYVYKFVDITSNREVVSDDTPVDVYTLDGVLIKKNITRREAVKMLPQGVYIVGGEKFILK
ncbi:calycin-like domain-containing protein [Falsiporphyromonas endometrii]|uniref:Calycin-like domain-containing protein n=1 Tax=Falsiporphyromonas endometrii TaxID=1387297 RepID=A0ABV9K6A5_9PORP